MGNEYEVIQDFDNKRANAHASLFVASMFGLFTLLALMARILNRSMPYFVIVLGLLFVSYVFVFVFGLYSLLNFFIYATVSEAAEEKIVEGKERELVEAIDWRGVEKIFVGLKVASKEPEKDTRRKGFLRNKGTIFAFIYALIGWLPFIAFWIWLICT